MFHSAPTNKAAIVVDPRSASGIPKEGITGYVIFLTTFYFPLVSNPVAYISSTLESKTTLPDISNLSKPAEFEELGMSPRPAITIDAALATSVGVTSNIGINSTSTIHVPATIDDINSATPPVAEATSVAGTGSVTASAVEAPSTAVGVESSSTAAVVAPPAVVACTVTSAVGVDSVTSVAGLTLDASVAVASETTSTPIDAKATSEAGVVSTTNVPTTNDSSTTTASHMANPMDVDLPGLLPSAASAIGKRNDTNEDGTGNFVTDSQSHFQTLAMASPGWTRLVEKWAEFEKHCSGTGVRF